MNTFEIITSPFIAIIKQIFLFSYGLTNNYGWAIILLSFGISLLLLPVFILIEKAKKKDDVIKGKMQSRIDEIKRVYKGQERYYYIKTLNRQFSYSPLKALIPILSLIIQIPFFIAAYQYLEGFEPLTGISFGFIKDLSQPDALFGPIHFLPIAMTLINLITAWFYTRYGDKSERKQMLIVAGIFLILLFNLPSGLVLYWTMNNVFSFFRLFVTNPEVFKSKRGYTESIKQTIISGIEIYKRNYNIVSNIVLFFIGYFLLAFLLNKDAYSVFSTEMLQFIILVLLLVNTTSLILSYDKLPAFKIKYFFKTIFTLAQILFWSIELVLVIIWIVNITNINDIRLITSIIIILLSHFVYNRAIINKQYKSISKVQNKLTKKLNPTHNIELLFFAAIVTFITPVVIYYSSPEDFYGRTSGLLMHVVLLCFLSTAALTTLFYFLKNWQKIIIKTIVALTLTIIIFGFIYQKELGIMRANRFINESLLNVDFCTVLIDAAIITSIFILVFKLYSKYRVLILILISLVFLIEGISLYKPFKKQYAYEIAAYSIEESNPNDAKIRLEQQFALSQNQQNILVFVLDGFSGFLMDDLIVENPEYKSVFDGFTWYRNTISCGSFTFPSVSALIGGHTKTINNLNKDKEHTFREKIRETVIDHHTTFTNAGYQTTYHKIPYLFNENSTYNDSIYQQYKKHIISREDLLAYRTNFVDDYATPEAKTAFATVPVVKLNYKLLFHLSLFKISPYILKKYIYDSYITVASKSKSVIERDVTSTKSRYRVSDSFWSSIPSLLNNGAKQPTIKVLWTKTMCRKYHVNEQLGPPVQEIRNKSFNGFGIDEGKISAKYFISKLSKIFIELKEQNIYDNTSIIIVADHGVKYGKDKTWDEMAIHPILMVKENNASGQLSISNKLMSNADIYSITSSIAMDKNNDINKSPLHNINDRELFYWSTKHGDKNTLDETTVDIHLGLRLNSESSVYNKHTWDTVLIKTLEK